MSKSKTSEIPHYELLYIISNIYSENELAPIMDKVKKIIKDQAGNITFSEEWGKKRLAYPIKHFRYGYYNLLEFDVEGGKIAKIDKELRLASEILRYQIVNKKKKSQKQIEKEEEITKKIASKKKKREAKDKKRKRVNIKDLDEKLDKILETDDLL